MCVCPVCMCVSDAGTSDVCVSLRCMHVCLRGGCWCESQMCVSLSDVCMCVSDVCVSLRCVCVPYACVSHIGDVRHMTHAYGISDVTHPVCMCVPYACVCLSPMCVGRMLVWACVCLSPMCVGRMLVWAHTWDRHKLLRHTRRMECTLTNLIHQTTDTTY